MQVVKIYLGQQGGNACARVHKRALLADRKATCHRSN
jgi:hypothetical protein